jgi:hypothetical protein
MGTDGYGGWALSFEGDNEYPWYPCYEQTLLSKTENDIGKWSKRLQEAMLEAGREEKRLAEERNDYHQGVPAITVIVDGGWSKRSHKHSYNAKSLVGIIIGHATGKLLFIGIQNKYCSACAQGISTSKHECYKNWDDSSSEMESDIGFQQAEATHGVRYLRLVTEIAQFIPPSFNMCRYGVATSPKSNALTTHASVTDHLWINWQPTM